MFVRETSSVMKAGVTDKLNVCLAVNFYYLKYWSLCCKNNSRQNI